MLVLKWSAKAKWRVLLVVVSVAWWVSSASLPRYPIRKPYNDDFFWLCVHFWYLSSNTWLYGWSRRYEYQKYQFKVITKSGCGRTILRITIWLLSYCFYCERGHETLTLHWPYQIHLLVCRSTSNGQRFGINTRTTLLSDPWVIRLCRL